MTTAIAPKTQLGRYQLVRHLASGGMADLWLARATGIEGFERHVAVKRIRQEQARDQRFVQMFLDEARLAASLHHNHIATVHDIGQEKGEYFFTMEYVHGEDLRKILMLASAREQNLPIEHVMTIVLAAASALHYAHEHKSQIVHRDVSPANIIIGYDGNIKVLDFGIAKAAHRTKDTQSGVLKGKVAYMSPEQCVGQPVDRRSDIFSLGIVLYELVTVRRLFKAANDFLTMSSIIHGEVPFPSTIRPGIPRGLEAIIMKALAPDRDERFQTAEELRATLERFCASNHIRTSSTLLADYMRSLFGLKPEPWLTDVEPELELSIDFDGTLPGVVRVPEAALKRSALPSTTPVQPGAPIMKARTKAITGAPLGESSQPVPAPSAAPISQQIAVARTSLQQLAVPRTSSQQLAVPRTSSQRMERELTPPAATPVSRSMEERSPFLPDEPSETDLEVEVPQAEGDLAVGDETLMVRPITVAPRVRRQVMIVFGIAAAIAVVAVVLITQLRGGDDDAPTEARPDIRLPPPVKDQPVVVPTPTPDAAETAVVVTPDAAAIDEAIEEIEEEEEVAGSASPGMQVKLREDQGSGSQSTKKKKKRQIKRQPPKTPPPKDDGEWDPTELFPQKK